MSGSQQSVRDTERGERADGRGTAGHPLDNPAYSALTGAHARFAERHGRLLRYRPDVSPWLALPDDLAAGDGSDGDGALWAEAAALAGPGGSLALAGYTVAPPAGWEITFAADGVQLVDAGAATAPDPAAVRLGPADVPEILGLVERTRPGPFLPRTVEMGTYLGIRHEGALVAMAGERMRPEGFSEISAVCTAPEFRGRGLAARLVLAVADGIRARGETAFLHAAADNTNAIRLYETLGFAPRRRTRFLGVRVPA
ncbi:GNAT family N-acetyltransferase [Streptomyces paludis]|uniref:GNAT family N-acetyltransferase n=1 Tax=Streptomyces paludis TaxID=2282738 RepID=A0A345HXS0_9ACTN|nr:GNAT family N-acetyltransferase [Streptomyces paludis]AXG81494.1 GNAT family N-acetyltransferase [Streptomyces paludis]